MFQVAFVECLSEKHLNTARYTFPLYLILIGVCVFLIAKAGDQIFFQGSVSGDTYVIAIPMNLDSPMLTLIAFLGGFSAATAMIIVATITLSQMLSNDVILPLVMRRQRGQGRFRDYTRLLIMARRSTVILVVFAAYLYQLVLTSNAALSSIGLIAFALSVHLAPAILLGLYWKQSNALGVYAGLASGLLVWAYTLILPLLADIGLVAQSFVTEGPFGIAWLSPNTLFGFEFSDAFTRAVLISLSINIAITYFVSRLDLTKLSDRIQASTFVKIGSERSHSDSFGKIKTRDLRELLRQFAGTTVTQKIFAEVEERSDEYSQQELIESVRRAISGIAGVASANSMIDSLRSDQKIAVEDVVSMFGETTRALRFNQEILFSSFENISSGISVVNAQMNIVAWNRRYEDMFNYPKHMLKVGKPVADLFRFNAQRGLLGTGEIEHLVQKRLSHLRNGRSYRVMREHQDGAVVEIKGTPLPDGGYVTTYDDISEFMHIQAELEASNQNLEKRVTRRTEEIHRINEDLVNEIELRKEVESALLAAKAQAEAANATKSRFLALASHDILQPLNAAQLYLDSLLETDNERRDTRIIDQIRNSIDSAESIIASLLDIARIDTNNLQPEYSSFELSSILKPLIDEAQILLPKQITLRYVPTSIHVHTDRNMLSRVIQNFISNAVKYTQTGRILIGCRRRGENAELWVCDTGPGISNDDIHKIFTDFYRSPSQQKSAGLGLGLAVAKRLADLLELPINVKSKAGKGSCFSISLPLATVVQTHRASIVHHPEHGLADMKIFYVDDAIENLDATATLLERWQCNMTGIQLPQEAIHYALSHPKPNAILMDYQLNDAKYDGLSLAQALRETWGQNIAVCIISAAADETLPNKAKDQGFAFLGKPVKPAKLKAWLNHVHEG